jgi:hypothetical protein
MTSIKIPKYFLGDKRSDIIIDERDCITDDLVPIIEISISIDKESLTRHLLEWQPYWNSRKGNTTAFISTQINNAITMKIQSYLDDKRKMWIVDPCDS